jgi:hypothetical protein
MKNFAIGDGHKRITCPNCYLADWETDGTTILWDAESGNYPVRASVLTVTPKEDNQNDWAFWSVIEKAKEKGIQPLADETKSI